MPVAFKMDMKFLRIAVLLPLFSNAQTISGEVTEIFDGNTLQVDGRDQQLYRVVLLGVDCPELSQPYGSEAREFLEKSLLNKEVVLVLHGKDRSGNYLGVVLLNDSTDIRHRLLEHGLAWTSEKGPIPDLEVMRKTSASQRQGLWSESNPVAPWIFRRQQSMLMPKSR